jgi:ubiquinone biosynthesis protein
MIAKRIRHLQRYRDIALALARHGFGFIVEETDIFQILQLSVRGIRGAADPAEEKKTLGERIRDVIQDLGPTFIKLGQIASTRPDMLPEDIISALGKLQDQVAPFPFGQAADIIEANLQRPIHEAFAKLDEIPLAAASIGQVHVGVLRTGERVAVKIQRPAVADTMKTDLEILEHMASLAESRFEWARRFQIRDMLREFGKSLLSELDYTNEGKNAEKIAAQFDKDDRIYVPKIYWAFSSKQVLTMEFIEGVKLTDREQLVSKGYDCQQLAKRLIQCVFHQIFIEGLFHADPHPGNILILPDETIAFMDFGMVGRLTPEMRVHFSSFIIALMRQSTDGIMKSIERIGLIDEQTDMAALRYDLDELRDKYYGVPLSEVSAGEIVNDLFDVAFRYRIRIPADLILLGKTLLTVEGIVEQLDPGISIVSMAEPFGLQLLKERYNPKHLGKTLLKDVSDYGDMLLGLPRQVKELLAMIKKGNVRFEIGVPELEQFLRKLDRIGNRISFSIVLLSFSIIMTGLMVGSSMAGRRPGYLTNVPTVELGLIVAGLMLLWLLLSIFRSGRF